MNMPTDDVDPVHGFKYKHGYSIPPNYLHTLHQYPQSTPRGRALSQAPPFPAFTPRGGALSQVPPLPASLPNLPRLTLHQSVKSSQGFPTFSHQVHHASSIHQPISDPRAINPAVSDPRTIHSAISDMRVISDPRAIHPAISDPRAIHPVVSDPRFIHPGISDPRLIHPAISDPREVHPTISDPRAVHPLMIDQRSIYASMSNPSISLQRLPADYLKSKNDEISSSTRGVKRKAEENLPNQNSSAGRLPSELNPEQRLNAEKSINSPLLQNSRLKVRVDILKSPMSQLQKNISSDRCPSVPPLPKSPESKGRKRTGEGEGENTTEKIKDKSPEMRKEAKKGNEKEARKGNEKEAPKRKSVSKAKSKEKEKNKDAGKEREEDQEEPTAVPSPESANKSTIDCPVCKDVAIAHFHYGGMCCYSCKAFFRRVVNTSKANKYKCRNGSNLCDVSLGNRRSCQACRYRKCVSAGMKPGLVLSDEQCTRRFGPRSRNRVSNPGEEEEVDNPNTMEELQDSEVTSEDLSVLIDGEKSYEEQNRIGRALFIALFDTGSVGSDRVEDRELDRFMEIQETQAMVKSFQIERQLNHSRKFLPFNSEKSGEKRKLFCENGKLNTGDLAQTLIDQSIMLLRHSKEFNKISLSDQTELLESNLMTITLLSIFEAYNSSTHTVLWKLTEQDFNFLAKEGIKVPHGRVVFSLSDALNKVDTDLTDDLTKLFNFFDYFSQIGLPRPSLYLLLLVVVFNQDCVDVKNKEDVESTRKYFLFSLFESLVASEGVLGACSIAARLHTALNDLNRIAHILGQKFIDVEES